MIEFCTRRRMVLAILVLFSLTVVTLIVEGRWSNNHKIAEVNAENESSCGSEPVKVIESCQQCSTLEINAGQVYCLKTGYREQIQCGKGKHKENVFKRSCKVDPWVEERKFWILELITCIVGIGTYGIVRHRQGILDQQLMEKVNRQIAA
ncbi:uncharacterized protein LOC132736137 [Ruditapes philippinarum]|uniref:uncharacterized protein LOC132718938 n=1 Tax=Ruditapes philippinarum TaxID=129788 RepID=UPI00295B26D8|nr:uncharacterized protein LOC132718938 [Ruditapes philippinarum]XP_060558629.1 uncharacterized protein LOC132718938 [Ruditapes philippinarum]XP_060558630.1 uncharacterized protein LOC132718938 [Ruditapes philippinarum]XP_060579201.1 uncharacterized protein LOC132736137 [Ruditapes philippinarum]